MEKSFKTVIVAFIALILTISLTLSTKTAARRTVEEAFFEYPALCQIALGYSTRQFIGP